jgi:MEDS: MEthanogen/methylotroph, DcmR Sensory domain
MKEDLITGSYNDILDHLTHAEYGTHSILVYPDIETLRETYSRYAKSQLEDNNEIVLILPYYETADKVRKTLSEGFVNNIADGDDDTAAINDTKTNSIIDVGKYEKEGSLMIVDSVKGYFGSDSNYEGEDRLMSFFKQLVEKAKSLRKNGVSVIADLGSFYHLQSNNATEKLFEHELSLPSKYEGMKFKGFCAYHKSDFDTRFTEEQKQKLLDHHSKALMIAKCS